MAEVDETAGNNAPVTDAPESAAPESADKDVTIPTADDQEESKKDIEKTEGEETVDGEHVEGEHLTGEHVEGEFEGEHGKEELVGEGEEGEEKKSEAVEGEGDVYGEMAGEGEVVDEQVQEEEKQKPPDELEMVEEEDQYVEEPPPDPAAPFNFSDSNEALKTRFELEPHQVAEVERVWDIYQDYNPAYSHIDNYITDKELIYMLKSLNLMTYTPEQLEELIEYCVRPPDPKGHITYEQFLKMVTLRQRDTTVEDELRNALNVLDPEHTGMIDREYFKEVVGNMGDKMLPKMLDNFIKEIDISNDGTIGIEDVVGTMCIDLNTEDLVMLRDSLFPPEDNPDDDDEDGGEPQNRDD